ncbi:MAG: carbamoyltransferase HypF [Candidatus Eremiobacteraeota bacterium]|nr:carbamoyltransferase HypF [Candidatus Eremiobacteraeota bacterium]
MLRSARLIRVRGVVQGVGFRPFAYRLAQRFGVTGWVENGNDGVAIHVEGDEAALDAYERALLAEAPPAARIASLHTTPAAGAGHERFAIRESERGAHPTVRISPDLPVCEACLRDLFDPADRRYRYPYINCTDCGPRYSIVHALPYDRAFTTMSAWPMCEQCANEYDDPYNRRFHAQPLACADCGPTYVLHEGNARSARGYAAIEDCAALLRAGKIVALKGIGGYHLACDARNVAAIAALRERKFRRERPFAVMTKDVSTARQLVVLDAETEALLVSSARPIVLAEAREQLGGVAPDNRDLGVMLPYAPLHHLLFAAGAPEALVVTSANRSSEPIAYEDDDARQTLGGIADAFLVGERAIARRVDDSVARVVASVPAVLRHARGLAPQAVATLPTSRPILAVGGDLKNAIAIAVDGQVFVSQHIGDLEHVGARASCEATIRDLCAMYEIDRDALLIAHDAHPGYASTAIARALPGEHVAVQHHRAHIASVLAERGAWSTDVIGVAFDGTGYGDDGTIWGGEFFSGNARDGLERIAHLRVVPLPGGDAAARFPVQAAAGFLWPLDIGELEYAPFLFPKRYVLARRLIARNVRCFTTSSMGRLFDTVAALLGFARETTFEGQAAMWLEHLATRAKPQAAYPFPYEGTQLDHAPLLHAIFTDRRAGRDTGKIAYGFHAAVADAIDAVCTRHAGPVVCSGGVFQNRLLVELVQARLGERVWFNRAVPANDGGLCLGQAALAAFAESSGAPPGARRHAITESQEASHGVRHVSR